MAVADGLATVLVGEDVEARFVGANRGDILHRAVFFNPSIDEVTKRLSEAFKDTFSGSKKDSGEVLAFTSQHLRQFTDNFDAKNRIGPTQFGAVFRGKIELGKMCRTVVVKVWDERADYLDDSRVPYIFVNEEVRFLTDKAIVSYPYIVKVIGKCCEENLRGIVYDLDPLDTLHNMMMKDNFSWAQRIIVALKFAQLLEFLHCQEKPYVVLCLDPHHIMLDHMLNPILFDFGLLSGGIIGELSYIKRARCPPHGYADLQYLRADGLAGDMLLPCCDVYTYGVILIGMIAKKVVEKEVLRLRGGAALDYWAREEYKPGTSLVHRSLESEGGYYVSDASSLTELAMCCMKLFSPHRPTMTEVINCLKQLQIVKDLLSV